ncbi:beta-ketoacyl synthase chain length factor [Ideonella paludis]|uniref:Beta-ketoacyl synthase chain length factor n=1 Tax=Ideonella paludis TaxID=1233411 RepID=A0ABS5DSX4_9BURK|nr:beta-ketoacyl synthase chain length factor [Ideonella paludis]MBQ0933981.1 beta-ketoacyl synthase chain length factor [Ideonella paludis]
MEVHFVINAWAAFAPGLSSAQDWQAWASSPTIPRGTAQAEVKSMPAMMRRRLNALGRMAAEVSYAATDAVGFPTIFASRYGDASRSLELLSGLAKAEPVSPTAFGLSVQNAIGAMVSMVREDRANMLALAGGSASAAAGIVEAAALLADGAPEVLLVHYDAPLPPDYAHFQDEPEALYAWAWRIAASPQPGAHGWTLTRRSGVATDAQANLAPSLPLGLALLRPAILPGHVERAWRDGIEWTLCAHG